MKLTRIETFTVVVPVHPGSWHSLSGIDQSHESWEQKQWWDSPAVVLRLHTDDGLTGLGEVPRGIAASDVERWFSFYEGLDVWDINLQALPLQKLPILNPNIYLGFEMALYDLMGKALGVPVYRLFGGKYRDRVPVSRCSGRMSPADSAKTAQAAVDMGYSVLKDEGDRRRSDRRPARSHPKGRRRSDQGQCRPQ